MTTEPPQREADAARAFTELLAMLERSTAEISAAQVAEGSSSPSALRLPSAAETNANARAIVGAIGALTITTAGLADTMERIASSLERIHQQLRQIR